MARSRRRRQRDTSTNTNQRLLSSIAVPSLRLLPDLRLFEDRREYRPERHSPARGVFSGDADTVVASPSRRADLSVPFRLAFRKPNNVFICVRRKQRREVLFAYRQTGRGARSPRLRNSYTDVRC